MTWFTKVKLKIRFASHYGHECSSREILILNEEENKDHVNALMDVIATILNLKEGDYDEYNWVDWVLVEVTREKNNITIERL